MSEEEYNKTFDPDFRPTELKELIGKYKQIVKLAKNNREQHTHCGMSSKNQREASVLHWLLFF